MLRVSYERLAKIIAKMPSGASAAPYGTVRGNLFTDQPQHWRWQVALDLRDARDQIAALTSKYWPKWRAENGHTIFQKRLVLRHPEIDASEQHILSAAAALLECWELSPSRFEWGMFELLYAASERRRWQQYYGEQENVK